MIDDALNEAGSCLNDGEERCDGADNDCDDLIDGDVIVSLMPAVVVRN